MPVTNSKQFNALSKKALAFGLGQTKKQFKKLNVLDLVEVNGVITLAKFKLEVSDGDGENKEFINVQIEQGQIKSKKTKILTLEESEKSKDVAVNAS